MDITAPSEIVLEHHKEDLYMRRYKVALDNAKHSFAEPVLRWPKG